MRLSIVMIATIASGAMMFTPEFASAKDLCNARNSCTPVAVCYVDVKKHKVCVRNSANSPLNCSYSAGSYSCAGSVLVGPQTDLGRATITQREIKVNPSTLSTQCPTDTTAQPNGTCLATRNFSFGNIQRLETRTVPAWKPQK